MCKNIFLHVKALYEPTMKIKTLLLYTKSKLKYVLVCGLFCGLFKSLHLFYKNGIKICVKIYSYM